MIRLFRSQTVSLLIIAGIVSLPLIAPNATRACGPFFTDAIFVYTKHPDMPLDRFAMGQLGVLRPSYARSYLVVAYRTLAGRPLDAKEVEALKSLWADRLNNSWEIRDDEWVKKWLEARKKVPNATAPAEIHVFRNRDKPREYESFLNCQQDAFENAERTLNERIAKFGADSAVVRDWLAAQDEVFANCGGGKQVPAVVQETADATVRADRAYQIGAAYFYATAFDEARQQFDAIAKDESSPWRTVAPYLAARALLRKGSFAENAEERTPPLEEAEARLNAVLKDRTLASSHHAATRLLNLTRLRLHPEEKLHELARAIAGGTKDEDLKQDVWDYTALLDNFIGDSEGDTKPQPVAASLREDDLTDWVLTTQDETTEAASHALDRWQKTGSTAWLVAALMHASAATPAIDALIAAATKIEAASPAFPSVAYHRVRLLIETGRKEEARNSLDKILANDRIPPSATNLFRGQRMLLATNLEMFVRDAQRKPAGFSDNDDGREIPADETEATPGKDSSTLFFDVDVANIFNRAMPVTITTEAAHSPSLAPNLRFDVARAAFVRAALLNDRDDAVSAGNVLDTIQPEMRQLLGVYERARTGDEQRFAALYLLLKFPGLRPYVNPGVGRTTALGEIDSYRDNWWCAEPPSIPNTYGETDNPKKRAAAQQPLPPFLQPTAAVAAKEYAALQALGTAPDYLCRATIDWSNKTPDDPRVPEALHLAVKATRYGCTSKQTGRWSKAAFDLLHRRYPNTSWAKETKYWFKD